VKKILVAMSGGVDSSVAAALLVRQGFEVVGATLRTFCYTSGPAHAKSCCGLEGVQDAKAVARALGIPHAVFDVEEAFTRDVIDDFVTEYARGRTPNPCVRCNSFTKFRDLLQRGREMGADGIATGHYVRVVPDSSHGQALLRGKDRKKDQAYFLWGLPRGSLEQLSFPLGEMTKPEVRNLAAEMGLLTADKPESQEICFVPTGDYRDLLQRRLDPSDPAFTPGTIVDRDGEVLGEHPGYANFTVGQRRGLPGGFPEALFVLQIRPEAREVVVGPRNELFTDRVEVDDLNWLVDEDDVEGEIQVQLRHRAPAAAAVLSLDGSSARLSLADPQPAVTPGQSAVIFRGDRVLGGGRIRESVST